ncbi:MAG: hypothetical protein HC876_01620 [Chloroflexaceae bacterium]|nr:hypothetical protein [Chloroflexaceae bacterium]NJO04324.1 hypothetical protein [Chloroflexaceae bacterium]NJO84189.1 hypothetical protein [Blastochloris sp.]
MRRNPQRMPLLLVAVLLVAGGALLVAWWQVGSTRVYAQRLSDAHARWDARPFRSYQLTLETTRFQQAQPIMRREVLTVRHADEPASVDYYLDMLTRFPREWEFTCGSITPDCRFPRTYRASVRYHTQLGYPQHIRIIGTRHPDWLNLTFWQWFFFRGGMHQCDNVTCTNTATEREITLSVLPGS